MRYGTARELGAEIGQQIYIVGGENPGTIEARGTVFAAAVQVIPDGIGIGIHFVHRFRPDEAQVCRKPPRKAPRGADLQGIIVAGGAKIGEVDTGIALVRPNGVVLVIGISENGSEDGSAEGQQVQIPDIHQVRRLVVHVAHIQRKGASQFALHVNAPGVSCWDLTLTGDRSSAHRKASTAGNERGREIVDVSGVERWRISEWRIAEAVKIDVVLADALIEDPGSRSHGHLAVA